MDTQALAMFVDVAKAGSFSVVARERGIDPSSVSRAVAALEGRIRTRLFERTTRSLALTQAGELYLARAPAIIEAATRLLDESSSVRSDPVGMVRVTASVAFGQTCIVPLLGIFAGRFPRLVLDLALTDTNVDIVADRVDLSVRLGSERPAGVPSKRLFGTCYRVVASPAYVGAHGHPSTPHALSDRDCLLYALPDFRSRWLFRSTNGDESVAIGGKFVMSNALALRQAARDGCGPALLANWLIDHDIASGALVDLFPTHRVTATSFDTAAWLLWASRDYLPRKTRAVMQFFEQSLAKPTA